jgi:hypothetical protein
MGQENDMASRIETTYEDLNSDGTYDRETVARFWYQDDKLVLETELIRDTLDGYESSKGISYAYNELGQEIFREIESDPFLGGIPDVTHVHSAYDERGFLISEVWQRMEWANPDNVVSYEIRKNFAYRDDGQPTLMREEHYPVYGDEEPSSYREEVWTYDDAGRVLTWKIDDPEMFDNDITRFYTYRPDGNLQNIRKQDEYTFGDDRPRVTESFSYKVDGSLKEQTAWGEWTPHGWAPWVQTQYTHTSPGYDKVTKLIDLTGDFKPEFKEVTDTWRNGDGQDTHILTSYYDSKNALTGRDLFKLTWEADHLVSETRDYNIWDGVVEYSFTSELLVA